MQIHVASYDWQPAWLDSSLHVPIAMGLLCTYPYKYSYSHPLALGPINVTGLPIIQCTMHISARLMQPTYCAPYQVCYGAGACGAGACMVGLCLCGNGGARKVAIKVRLSGVRAGDNRKLWHSQAS